VDVADRVEIICVTFFEMWSQRQRARKRGRGEVENGTLVAIILRGVPLIFGVRGKIGWRFRCLCSVCCRDGQNSGEAEMGRGVCRGFNGVQRCVVVGASEA